MVGDKDGHVDFVRKPQTFGTESHIFSESKELQDGDYTVTVPSITVKTLAKRYDIPVNFGILSIDAEGFGAQVNPVLIRFLFIQIVFLLFVQAVLLPTSSPSPFFPYLSSNLPIHKPVLVCFDYKLLIVTS